MSDVPEMPVFLVDYDSNWPSSFADEREELIKVLADKNPDIEHIGSTAVPGIAAKPIIDIMVLIDSIADAAERAGNGQRGLRSG